MTDRPTLRELRARVQKDRHREIGNWLARRVARPSAVHGTWLAVRLGLSANQVTFLALSASVACALGLGSGSRAGFLTGVACAHLAFWLDHVDGQVARWRGSASLDGVYLDYLMHHIANMLMGFSLGHGLSAFTGDPIWSVAGFAVALGWAGLSLHNDCRYKAFFQRLKRESRTYRVDCGGGGRPAPPPGWPLSWPGLVTWPAAKLCEPHVALVSISLLAAVALADTRAWRAALIVYVLGMAVLAPALACGRIARAVSRSATETEFTLWFQESREIKSL